MENQIENSMPIEEEEKRYEKLMSQLRPLFHIRAKFSSYGQPRYLINKSTNQIETYDVVYPEFARQEINWLNECIERLITDYEQKGRF